MDRITYEILELIYALRRQRVIIYSIGVLFLISFLVSYILILNIPWVQNFGKEMLIEFSTSLNLRDIGSMDMEEIFFLIMRHNLCVNMLNYILNIFSTFVIVFNAFILAYVLSISNPLIFILLICPHGIVEIPALILGSSAGVVLFTSFLNRLKGNNFEASAQFWDSLRLLFVSMVLFTVAAFIESFITFGIKSLLILYS
ncbi:MAG TPA: stage II sporulation protein M [Methanothermococcus okinawensis]|nr:stage II sporulation protein M [Methanothermococcus okinawensis]